MPGLHQARRGVEGTQQALQASGEQEAGGGIDMHQGEEGGYTGRALVLLPAVREALLDFEELLDPKLLPKVRLLVVSWDTELAV